MDGEANPPPTCESGTFEVSAEYFQIRQVKYKILYDGVRLTTTNLSKFISI